MDWVVPGAVLAGKYTLERKLGQGGMGAVWRAQHLQLRSPVAIKVIDEQIAGSADALGRFMREAQSAAALRSPHVVQILDYGTDRGVPFIAMELLEGESLATRLERVGRLPPAEVARIITEVARAIGKAHELAIVHRDLKPDNIYLVHNDEAEVTKVLDFGIAKSTPGIGVASGSETRTGAILGTPHYMSPEQAEGTRLVDHRTDVWALGVIAFECLLGRRPFDSEALGSLLLAICTRPIPVPSAWGFTLPGFDAWFARACARELGERFQSARELASELRRIVGADGREAATGDDARGAFSATTPLLTPFVAVPPTGSALPAPPAPKRKRPLLALALGGAVTLAAVGSAVAVAFATRHGEADAAREAPHAAPSILPSAAPADTPLVPSAASLPPSVTPSAALEPALPSPAAATKPSAPARARPATRKPEKAATTPSAPSPPPATKVNLGI